MKLYSLASLVLMQHVEWIRKKLRCTYTLYLQAALATCVDLRCYLVLSQTADGEVTLELPDFDHHVKWNLSTLTRSSSESNGTVITSLR